MSSCPKGNDLPLVFENAARARSQTAVWIGQLYDSAMRQATEDERAIAGVYLKRWLENRRE